jgi:ketosteroid isomerase-like protein
MSNSIDYARRWLKTLASSDFAAWDNLVHEDVHMRFPFAPPGIPGECAGRANCLQLIRGFFAAIESFEWYDLQLHAAQDPALVFGTGKSRVRLKPTGTYGNEYCFVMKFFDGKLIEYREYFNPLPAMAAFTQGRS